MAIKWIVHRREILFENVIKQIIKNRSENSSIFNYWLDLTHLYVYKSDFNPLIVALIILTIVFF